MSVSETHINSEGSSECGGMMYQFSVLSAMDTSRCHSFIRLANSTKLPFRLRSRRTVPVHTRVASGGVVGMSELVLTGQRIVPKMNATATVHILCMIGCVHPHA